MRTIDEQTSIATPEAAPEPAPAAASETPVAQEAAPVEEAQAAPSTLVSRDPYGPTPDQPQQFVTLALVQPDEFCRSLENAGLKNPTFIRAPWPAENWTCVPEMLKATDGDENSVSSLFVSVRGDELDRIASVRLKLNLLDPETTPRIRAVAKDILMRVTAAFGDSPPQDILNAIDAGRDARVEDRGAVYEIKREFGEPRRDNLFVNFKQKLGEGGEDRFVATTKR